MNVEGWNYTHQAQVSQDGFDTANGGLVTKARYQLPVLGQIAKRLNVHFTLPSDCRRHQTMIIQ